MFGFLKRKENPSSSGRFHVLLLSGNRVTEEIVKTIFALSDADKEKTAFVLDDDGGGGMIVTPDDPGSLRTHFVSSGFKVATVSIPQRRSNETAHVVSMDLKLTGEYRQMRADFL